MQFSDRILSIIKEDVEKANNISLDTNIRKDLEIDSLDFLIVINSIEDEFSINIDEKDFSEIETIGEMILKLEEQFPDIGKD